MGVCDLKSREKILRRIVANAEERGPLGPGQDYRFGEIPEHEGQGAGRVDHGVGPVKDHEAVVIGVGPMDSFGYLTPVLWAHVARVARRDTLITVDGELKTSYVGRGVAKLRPRDDHMGAEWIRLVARA